MHHLLPRYGTLRDFAQQKRVYPADIQLAIEQGIIEAILVGQPPITLIEYDQYKDVQFQHLHDLSAGERERHRYFQQIFYGELYHSMTDPHQLDRMILLPSVNSAVDLDLNIYPLRMQRDRRLEMGDKIPFCEIEGDWFTGLSFDDLEALERLKWRKCTATIEVAEKEY